MSKKSLTIAQKDFICRKLAQFVPHRRIASTMRERYPEIDLDENELGMRIKYYASGKKAAKWRKRIEMYRNILNSNLRNRFVGGTCHLTFTPLLKVICVSQPKSMPMLASGITFCSLSWNVVKLM